MFKTGYNTYNSAANIKTQWGETPTCDPTEHPWFMNARIMDTSFADQGYRGNPSDFDNQHPETISYLKWQQLNWKKKIKLQLKNQKQTRESPLPTPMWGVYQSGNPSSWLET